MTQTEDVLAEYVERLFAKASLMSLAVLGHGRLLEDGCLRPDGNRLEQLQSLATDREVGLGAPPEHLTLLGGYPDGAGPRLATLALAQRRAKWVMDYLVGKGIAASRITVVSRGAACQGKNRRVHFLVRDTGSVQVTASPSR